MIDMSSEPIKPIRILVLGWFGSATESGGMEVHIREICRNIASEKIAITLAVPCSTKNLPAQSNIEIIRIPCTTRAKSIGSVIKNVSYFNKNIESAIAAKGAAFDIIHSHDWLCVDAAKNISAKYGVPWIHTVHSLEHIRAAEETNSVISKIEKSGICGADKIITVSRLMKNEIIIKYKVASEKIIVIGNSSSLLASGKTHRETGEKTVLFAGRLALQKGIETLISAFAQVLASHPYARLIIAGEGNLKNSLCTFARINGIEKNVSFKGHVSEKELKELYANASLFVSPSVFEPFGITILDAAGSGVPAIATRNTGALEIFGNESIAVVGPQKREDLAGKIISLLGSENMREEMALHAKRDMDAAPGWKEIAGETKKTYAEALAAIKSQKPC